MKFDFDKKTYIGCIPLESSPEHPKDQSTCIISDCPCCQKPMWVSEKKRAFQAGNPNREIYCIMCLVKAALEAGFEPGIMDLGAMQ